VLHSVDTMPAVASKQGLIHLESRVKKARESRNRQSDLGRFI
jgi:hypothetical protein